RYYSVTLANYANFCSPPPALEVTFCVLRRFNGRSAGKTTLWVYIIVIMQQFHRPTPQSVLRDDGLPGAKIAELHQYRQRCGAPARLRLGPAADFQPPSL